MGPISCMVWAPQPAVKPSLPGPTLQIFMLYLDQASLEDIAIPLFRASFKKTQALNHLHHSLAMLHSQHEAVGSMAPCGGARAGVMT